MTTREDASPNVLRTLDHRPATSFYWSLTLNFVPYHLTRFAQGYVVSFAALKELSNPDNTMNSGKVSRR